MEYNIGMKNWKEKGKKKKKIFVNINKREMNLQPKLWFLVWYKFSRFCQLYQLAKGHAPENSEELGFYMPHFCSDKMCWAM